MINLITRSKHTFGNQVPMFLIMGGLNTLFAYALFALFIALGLHYTIATLLPGLLSIYLGYLANHKIVFKAQTTRQYGLVLYYLFYLVIYLINISIQATMHALGFSNDYVNGAVAIVITTMISFVTNKYYFFADRAM